MNHPASRAHLKFTLIPALVVCAAMSVGCAGKGKKKSKNASGGDRAEWLENPSSGSTAGSVISVPDLAVKFHVPDTLYVFKDCVEAPHKPTGPDNKWIPIVQCAPSADAGGDEEEFGGDDEEGEGSDFAEPVVIYAAPKDMVINERAVETFRAKYQHEGWAIDDIGYITDYQSKPGRTGIEMRVHQSSGEEILRFLFPVGDIMFIVQVKYPMGADRSGLAQDWQRIVWGFQLDEDGPLYADHTGEDEAGGEAEEG